MLRDVVPFDDFWRAYRPAANATALSSFIGFLERKFGASFVYDSESFPYSRPDLARLFEVADRLRGAGIIRSLVRAESFPDEPFLSHWFARYRDTEEENTAGGCSVDDDADALVRTLAEALERHLWYERDDYFIAPTIATETSIARRGRRMSPQRFAGISDDERARHGAHLAITAESEFLWIRGNSLLDGSRLWIPAQTVSAHASVSARLRAGEPEIRHMVTNGLATHPDRTQAVLSGALEIIERDAYMVTWLNQLSPQRFDVRRLAATRLPLNRLLARISRYRLRAHFLRLPTDAPTYAFASVVEDSTGNAPCIVLGLKAHQNAAQAAEGALIEALRARDRTRQRLKKNPEVPGDARMVRHLNRLQYWADPEKAARLQFLIESPLTELAAGTWEKDDAPAHLARIRTWCNERGYELASVPMTASAANATPWHVEMVVMPELQPIYFSENVPHVGGTRVSEIPHLFGYTARATPFTDEPHPYA